MCRALKICHEQTADPAVCAGNARTLHFFSIRTKLKKIDTHARNFWLTKLATFHPICKKFPPKFSSDVTIADDDRLQVRMLFAWVDLPFYPN